MQNFLRASTLVLMCIAVTWSGSSHAKKRMRQPVLPTLLTGVSTPFNIPASTASSFVAGPDNTNHLIGTCEEFRECIDSWNEERIETLATQETEKNELLEDHGEVNSHLNNLYQQCHDIPVIRLTSGPRPTRGLLQVLNNDGQWGSVCFDAWDHINTVVACRLLGFGNAIIPSGNGPSFDRPTFFKAETYGMTNNQGDVEMDETVCHGTEDTLLSCPHLGPGDEDCIHEEDIGLDCQPLRDDTFEVRLGDSPDNGESGRVEINYGGVWGTMCDDYFDDTTAQVICHMLGHHRVTAQATYESSFGDGTGPIWLDDVICEGDEDSLTFCAYAKPGSSDCTHGEDAGVICQPIAP